MKFKLAVKQQQFKKIFKIKCNFLKSVNFCQQKPTNGGGGAAHTCVCVLAALLCVRLQELQSVTWILIPCELTGGSDWTSGVTRFTIITIPFLPPVQPLSYSNLSRVFFSFLSLGSCNPVFSAQKGMSEYVSCFSLHPLCVRVEVQKALILPEKF